MVIHHEPVPDKPLVRPQKHAITTALPQVLWSLWSAAQCRGKKIGSAVPLAGKAVPKIIQPPFGCRIFSLQHF